jgi:hypothetical protein
VLAGGALACGYIAIFAIVASLCGLSDEAGKSCARVEGAATPLAWCFGSVAVALTVLGCAFPRRRALRYALWATPTPMAVTMLVIATL